MTTCIVEGCDIVAKYKHSGMCSKHAMRVARHGDPNIVKGPGGDKDPIDRFTAKIQIDFETGCWIWTGGKLHGYASFSLGRGRTVSGHRWSYKTFVGPIPEGLTLDHLCRTPACVNPDHLEPVTMGENTRRGESPGAIAVRTNTCVRGLHELTPENTYVTPSTGFRRCRECRRATDRAYRLAVAS